MYQEDLLFLPDLVVREHPLNLGRVAWWLALPGLEGTHTYYDILGHNHGALTNMATSGWRTAYRPGGWGALDFDGSDDVVVVPRGFGPQQVTIAVWIYNRTGVATQVLAYLGGGSYLLWVTGTNTLSIEPQSSPFPRISATFAVNQWVRAVFTQDTTPTLRIYLDGQLAASGAGAVIGSPGAQMVIGRWSSVLWPWNGLLDDLSISTRTWSADEVREDYDQSRRGYPDLLRRYRPRAILHVTGAPPGGDFVDLAGTITGTSTATGTLARSRPLAGTVAGTSAVSGSLAVSRVLAGTVAGTGTVTGTLATAATHDLAGQAAGTSTVAGTLARSRPLAASTVAGTSTVTGTLAVTRSLAGTATGQATLTGTLETAATVLLAGTTAGQSSVSGSLAVSRPLAGTSAGTSAVSGSLVVSRSLAGQSTGTGAVAGSLAVSRPLAGTVAGTSTVTGFLSTAATVDLAGTVTGQSSVSASLQRRVGLRGTIAGTSAVTGALTRLRGLSGTVTGQASLAGSLAITRRLAGSVTGLASVTSRLAVLRLLAGAVAGQSTVTGDLVGGVRWPPPTRSDRFDLVNVRSDRFDLVSVRSDRFDL